MALYLGSNKVGSGSGNISNAVLYTEQNLTEEQQEQARANIGACIIPRVELTTKMRTADFCPCRNGFYSVSAEDAVALEEARKSGIFYVSAHVADQDCNPWHLGGIATYAFYDDGLAENSEIYTISQDIEGVVHRLTLVREHLDTGADWIFEYRVGWDNFEVVNNSEEYPEPSELV